MSRSTIRYRRAGDPLGEAHVLLARGRLSRRRGNAAAARNPIEQALTAYRDKEDTWDTALALWELGRVVWQLGECFRAQALYREAAVLLERLGVPAAAEVREESAALESEELEKYVL